MSVQYEHAYFSNRKTIGTSSEKAMAPHFSTLAWKIPWAEEPGGLEIDSDFGGFRVNAELQARSNIWVVSVW